MKHKTRFLAAVMVLVTLVAVLFTAACAPRAVIAQTSAPVASPTATPSATPISTPKPTPSPTPTPQVIEFGIERSLVESTAGAEIIFHQITYTKNQDMVLTFTISNNSDKYDLPPKTGPATMLENQ